MSHHFENAYAHCMDARLQRAIHEDWVRRNLYGKTYRISWPGTIKDLVSSKNPEVREHMIEPFEIAYNHGIRRFILTQHVNCARYQIFDNKDTEWNQHRADLNEAERLLLKRFPDAMVEKQIIRMQGDEVIDFITV